MKISFWCEFLRLSAKLHDTGEIQAVFATDMDRIVASHDYAKRMNYNFRAVKLTALIDCSTVVVLYELFIATTTRLQGCLAASDAKHRQPADSDAAQRYD